MSGTACDFYDLRRDIRGWGLSLIGWLSCAASLASAEDWPTFRHDVQRSGVTSERLLATRLEKVWEWQSGGFPNPAWAGPAKWDAYAGIRDLRSMRNYDNGFQPVSAQGQVYFGSSVDDTVRCLNAKTGALVWQFVTDGPIRVAPTLSAGHVYFGSDDGYAYCLESSGGQLKWRRRIGPEARKILQHGRLISPWPCRTGVVVDRGTAYFGASLLPWNPSYLMAVDALTGEMRDASTGTFRREFSETTLDGPLALSQEQLVAPQGRIPPRLYARRDGEFQGSLSGGGGCFVIVSSDNTIMHGPGNKTGWITQSRLGKGERLATLKDVLALRLQGSQSFLLTSQQLAASRLNDSQLQWTVDLEDGQEMIVAGSTLVVGTRQDVRLYDSKDGRLICSHEVDGAAVGLAFADQLLLVSTEAGRIYAFRGVLESTPPSADLASQPNQDVPLQETVEIQTEPRTAPGLVSRWVFQQDQRRGPLFSDMQGQQHATARGRVKLTQLRRHQAFDLDGKANSLMIKSDLNHATLPSEGVSIEAWVRVDTPLTWGGIASAIQDNGSYERGWLLGFRQSKFCFGVKAIQGPGRLTYLTAPEDFTLGQWYHVVGTYDGKTQSLYVDGVKVAQATDQRGPIDYPPTGVFELGAYHDDDEYFRMTGALHEVALYDRSLPADRIQTNARQKQLQPPASLKLAWGPYWEFLDERTARVRWESVQPSPTRLVRWTTSSGSQASSHKQVIHHEERRRQHEVLLRDLPPRGQVSFWVEAEQDGQLDKSITYECDNFFNYTSYNPPLHAADPARDATTLSPTAQQLLDELGPASRDSGGICLVYGCGDGEWAELIANHTRLRVIGIDTRESLIAQGRRRLLKAGKYGTRVSLYPVSSLHQWECVSGWANVIVVPPLRLEGGEIATHGSDDFATVARLLHPYGGRCVWLGPGPAEGLRRSMDGLPEWTKVDLELKVGAALAVLKRRPPADHGVWTHLYGRPDNSAFGGESLGETRQASQLELQWIGRPGPRYQPDRSGRKPSPLSANGRLFVQGLERLIALDTHNGTILWSHENPGIKRFNMPRDCSNWCADEASIYVTVESQCWQLDAATGRVEKRWELPAYPAVAPAANSPAWDWGFIASVGQTLLGSRVKQGTSFTNFWGGGGAGWYDAQSGEVTAKVCSDQLFALDKTTGETRWTHQGGLVINPTITASGDRVIFAECRSPKLKSGTARRLESPELWEEHYLVALDLHSGDLLWERRFQPRPGSVVYYLAVQDPYLVTVTSADKRYQVTVLRSDTGEDQWESVFDWPGGRGDHGTHMSRPAIVGDQLFVRPMAFQLSTGKRLALRLPGGGCGTYACTTQALFFRSGTVTMWDTQEGDASTWLRLRPDCWLSTIPACGMLLSPEGGGGCSCGNWLETSMAFAPRSDQP